MGDHPFDTSYDARPGANHRWPPGSEHAHWLFFFGNNRGAEVATDRDDPDRWWVQPLRDGAIDPQGVEVRGLDADDVVDLLDEIAALPLFDPPPPRLPDDADDLA